MLLTTYDFCRVSNKCPAATDYSLRTVFCNQLGDNYCGSQMKNFPIMSYYPSVVHYSSASYFFLQLQKANMDIDICHLILNDNLENIHFIELRQDKTILGRANAVNGIIPNSEKTMLSEKCSEANSIYLSFALKN